MSTTVKVQIQQRIDTAANWASANPTPLSGEICWNSDDKKYKIGDGSTAWASLSYAPGSGGYTAGTGVSISASNVISASAVALTTVQTAANETAHLALTTQEGDVVVRSDENKSYVRNSGTAGSMADFTLLATPTDAVLSVNGNTGAITADQLAAAIESATDSNKFTDADHTKLNGIDASANNYAITSDLLDEDDFASNSDAKVPSQQSTKAYVDTADALKANLSGATFTGDVVFTGDITTTGSNKKITSNSSDSGKYVRMYGSSGTGRWDIYGHGANLRFSDNESAGNIVFDRTLDANGGANFTGDVVFTGDAANVTWDKSTDDLIFNDNAKAIFGTSSDGVEIFHDGSNSHIKDTGTGNLVLSGSAIQIENAAQSEFIAKFIQDGATELYWDGSKKFETTSSGVTVTGDVIISDWTFTQTSNAYLTFKSGNASDAGLIVRTSDGTQRGVFYANSTNEAGILNSSGSWSFKADNSGNCTATGTCTATQIVDSKGNVRDIPQNTQTSAYTLAGTDAGKHIYISSGGVTVPGSVYGAGNAVTIINNSGSDQTITQGSGMTMYNTADGSTGNRTLAGRGMATILFVNSSASYISGAGLS